MNGLGGVIAKLTNAKNNALVIFDSPEEANTGDENDGQNDQHAKYEVRRKVKLTERISPFSKKQGYLAKGDVRLRTCRYWDCLLKSVSFLLSSRALQSGHRGPRDGRL